MLTKQFKFTDFNENERHIEVYFHVTPNEFALFVSQFKGGLENHLRQKIADNDVSGYFETLTGFIELAYGVASEDGLRFIKSPQHIAEFKQTPMWEMLVDEVMSDMPRSFFDFLAGCLPAKAGADAKEKFEEVLVEYEAEVKAAEDKQKEFEKELMEDVPHVAIADQESEDSSIQRNR